MAKTISAAPSWAASSLQWLVENRPEYTHRVGRPSDDVVKRLSKSLRMMSFDRAARIGDELRPDYEKRMDRVAASWNGTMHEQMRTFLERGGFRAEQEALKKPEPTLPDDVVSDIEKELEPPSEHSPEREIEELLAEEESRRNPTFASW
jgi:hypothetical protein